ncbi:proteinase [Intrasporangium oryzae NRRL B-24470]|uniref:Proteinase n=1 Tax=Intrasporangium oryzae NRRL B-24470 TaxID=1386089 RepID=W9GFK8_9MICO|nr:alpha/beta hydrolase [Intrasporangium oryzae]EWT03608.1 proteinase [Intrasporangium oryzae NRRL B-24470]
MTPRTRAARALAALGTVAAIVLGAAACSTPAVPLVLPSDLPGATVPPTPELARYYSQQLAWKPCTKYECADLTVPIDYARPGDGDIALKVLRVKAGDQGDRIGSLVVNPGGPGASGVNYAVGVNVGPDVHRYFDIVGFDPRGVGRSAHVDCLSDGRLDQFLGTDPTPDSTAEEQDVVSEAKTLAAGCETRNARLLPHLSTVDVAKDMDILRAALGEGQLTYLGKSYGTFIGSTYADLFPERVGRFVLDGVVPPDLSSTELAEGQARGFERATRSYVQDCVDQGDCPIGGSVDEGMAWIRDFLRRADTDPLPTGDPKMPHLTEAWASYGLGEALYDQGMWGILTAALEETKSGSASGLMSLADSYTHRNPNGTYSDNLMESIYAVNCLDRPDSPDLSSYEANAKKFSVVAPTWGPFLAWGQVPCGVWPVKGGAPPHTVSAAGSNTIVVVGTTRDPATPYEWSKRLRDQLSNAVLVTWNGDGHTAYGRSNDCIDNAIDAWYVQGQAPKDGLTC